MTVRELRDILDNYIKRDVDDIWQLNDVELDTKAYKERCEERANREVLICDDGMKAKFFEVDFAGGTAHDYKIGAELPNYESRDVFCMFTNLTKEV